MGGHRSPVEDKSEVLVLSAVTIDSADSAFRGPRSVGSVRHS